MRGSNTQRTQFLQQEHSGAKVMMKGDYSNAFNAVHRRVILKKVAEVAPKAFPYAKQAYSK